MYASVMAIDSNKNDTLSLNLKVRDSIVHYFYERIQDLKPTNYSFYLTVKNISNSRKISNA